VFVDAERASSFLCFVVERTFEGHAGEVKESVIAVEVLVRAASFDSKSDPIVRVEAGRLRDRLTAYYEAEGAADLVLISRFSSTLHRFPITETCTSGSSRSVVWRTNQSHASSCNTPTRNSAPSFTGERG
jgi:hypothetical protein